MDDTMLVDLHIHSAGISWCSRIPVEELIPVCVRDGLGGIVLTNHSKSEYMTHGYDAWKEQYVAEYRRAKALGEAAGVKVFFGVEISLDEMPQNHFTVYGLSVEDFLRDPAPHGLTLPQLSDYLHSRNALLYHAHPFRSTVPVDGTLLDGTEINCHPLYHTCAEEKVRAFADAYGLRLACGSDWHGDTYKAYCGVWMPKDIETDEDLTEFLRTVPRPALQIAPDPEPGMDIGPGTGRMPRSRENP